jgi:hypothetical protein
MPRTVGVDLYYKDVFAASLSRVHVFIIIRAIAYGSDGVCWCVDAHALQSAPFRVTLQVVGFVWIVCEGLMAKFGVFVFGR